jgi:hypothetical protein
LLQTAYPSWGYMPSVGATTVWERWNGDVGDLSMNSYNHYAFGAVVAFSIDGWGDRTRRAGLPQDRGAAGRWRAGRSGVGGLSLHPCLNARPGLPYG